MADLTLNGLDSLNAKLDQLTGNLDQVVGKALYQAGQIVMTASKRVCPVKTGFLRSSGTVDEPVTSNGKASVLLHYDAPYAIYVHEGARGRPPNKFLEGPAVSAASDISSTVQQAVKAELEGLSK